MRKWIKQDKRRCCGQIAVAVITGRSLKYIIKLIGHDHGTQTRELARVLWKLGYKCPSRLKRLKERPKLAIAKLSHKLRHGWHWVVIDRKKFMMGSTAALTAWFIGNEGIK